MKKALAGPIIISPIKGDYETLVSDEEKGLNVLENVLLTLDFSFAARTCC